MATDPRQALNSQPEGMRSVVLAQAPRRPAKEKAGDFRLASVGADRIMNAKCRDPARGLTLARVETTRESSESTQRRKTAQRKEFDIEVGEAVEQVAEVNRPLQQRAMREIEPDTTSPVGNGGLLTSVRRDDNGRHVAIDRDIESVAVAPQRRAGLDANYGNILVRCPKKARVPGGTVRGFSESRGPTSGGQ